MSAMRPMFHVIPVLALAASALVCTARGSLSVSAPDSFPTGRTVTAEQLWQEFDGNLPDGVWVSPLESERYEVISALWLRRTFLPSLRRQTENMRRRNIPEGDTAANCSGFALVCRLMLALSAMDAGAHSPATATVIVHQDHPFGGLDATRENHCVAFVLTDEGPWIIEAQSGAFTQLAQYPNRTSIKFVSVH